MFIDIVDSLPRDSELNWTSFFGWLFFLCRYKEGLRCISNVWPCSTYIKNE